MSRKVPWSTILFVLVTAALLFQVVRSLAAGPAANPREKDAQNAAREAKPPAGNVDERAPVPASGLIGGNGLVEPADRETRVAAAVPGLVISIVAKEGQRVKKDDVLVELDDAVELAAVKAAEADLAASRANLDRTQRGQRVEDRDAAEAEAKSAKARADQSAVQLERTEKLVKGGAATQEELDKARLTAAADKESAAAAEARAQAARTGSRVEDIASARAQVASAQGRLDQAKATLERKRVRAPYDAEVLQVKARVGEYFTPGQGDPLLVVGDTSKLRVRMDVDERDIGRVKIGATGFAVADAFPGQKFAGRVVEIGRRMGRKNVRTDDPVERIDTKILEVVLELEPAKGLVPGLRVASFIQP